MRLARAGSGDSARIGAALGLGLVVGLSAALVPLRTDISRAAPALLLVIPIVLAGLVGGRVAAGAAAFAFNFAFIPPYWTLEVHAPDDIVALVVFGSVAIVVGTLVAREGERRQSAEDRASELQALNDEFQVVERERQRLAAPDKQLPGQHRRWCTGERRGTRPRGRRRARDRPCPQRGAAGPKAPCRGGRQRGRSAGRGRHPQPRVVILDLGLPDIDGIDVCRQLRRWTDTPIIVLTAEGAESRKVEALDEGAADYVTKPFSTPELLARVRVALRHRRDPESKPLAPVLTVGEIEIDIPRHRVTVRGAEVDLTPKEFSFLTALARHPGRVLTHGMLLHQVWGPDYGAETQYLRVYASHLRKKLDDDPARPCLVNEPGVGYRLVDSDEHE